MGTVPLGVAVQGYLRHHPRDLPTVTATQVLEEMLNQKRQVDQVRVAWCPRHAHRRVRMETFMLSSPALSQAEPDQDPVAGGILVVSCRSVHRLSGGRGAGCHWPESQNSRPPDIVK